MVLGLYKAKTSSLSSAQLETQDIAKIQERIIKMKMVFSIIIYTFGIACLFSPSLSRPLSMEVLQDNSSNQSNASDIPAYVMELYTKLSMMERYDLLPSDSYNTIRSFENIPSGKNTDSAL